MTLPFEFGWESGGSISILLVCAAFGFGYYWKGRNIDHKGQNIALVMAIVAIILVVSMTLPRTLAVPALTITTEGIWCAPWSQPLHWADVTKVSSITHESTSKTSRYSATTKFEALKLRHRETVGDIIKLKPWPKTPGWLRPSIWLTHWSGAAVYDYINDDNEDPVAYCNLADLNKPAWEVERLAEVLMKAQQKALQPDYPNYLEVISQCESDTRAVDEFCVNYIWTEHRRCESQDNSSYTECMKDFLGRVDSLKK